MKKYLHINHQEIPLYMGYFVMIITNSRKKVLKYLPDFQDKNVFAHTWLGNYKDRQAFFMILNFDHKKSISHGVITHE